MKRPDGTIHVKDMYDTQKEVGVAYDDVIALY